jgi:hypothetical protein
VPLRHRYQAGRAATFAWRSPACTLESVTPSLVVTFAAGAQTLSMTRLRANASVTAIDDARRVLTVSSISSVEGHAGADGQAWLRTVEGGIFSVRVVSIDDSAETVTLAEALPRNVDVAGSTLTWATWVAPLLSGWMVAQRDVPWSVTWQETRGDDAYAPTRRDEGLLQIVRQPFDTQLSEQDLRSLYSWVHENRREQGVQAAIDATLEELAIELRAELQQRGLDENDVNGEPFRLAHAAKAAAHIADAIKPGMAEALLAKAARLTRSAMQSMWVDANRDGAVDSGERDRLYGAVRRRVGGSFSAATTRTFTTTSEH